jgi:hypothetical protein
VEREFPAAGHSRRCWARHEQLASANWQLTTRLTHSLQRIALRLTILLLCGDELSSLRIAQATLDERLAGLIEAEIT